MENDGRVSHADFGRVAAWYEARGGDSPSREMLPGCGAVAEKNGQPVAIAFLYLDATGSGVAWLAWLATCPRISRHLAGRAVRHLIAFLSDHARSMNYWLLTATYHHPSLVSLLRRLGWKTADTGMTQLLHPL